MLFCEDCSKTLDKDTTSGVVKMKCPCGRIYDGTPEDTLIMQSFNPSEGRGGVQESIAFAPFDRVNQRVDTECKECKSKYMTQVVNDRIACLVCGRCGTIYKMTDF